MSYVAVVEDMTVMQCPHISHTSSGPSADPGLKATLHLESSCLLQLVSSVLHFLLRASSQLTDFAYLHGCGLIHLDSNFQEVLIRMFVEVSNVGGTAHLNGCCLIHLVSSFLQV